MGMRIIEPSWICFRSIDGEDEWITDPKDDPAVKVVKHDASGSLLWETDSYSSGREATVIDHKIPEEIKLHCDYSSSKLTLIYLGDDENIKSWVKDAGTNNLACLAVIERVKARWFQGGKQ
jgi:hypothetical protein